MYLIIRSEDAKKRKAISIVFTGLLSDHWRALPYVKSIPLWRPLRKIFPSGFTFPLNILLEMNGMIVRATNNDPITMKVTEVGSVLIYFPAMPGRNISGRKARIRVAVHPITARPIWPVAFTAASEGEYPSLTHRDMFSTTTIESSTRSPSEITAPTMLSWFILKPTR